MTWQTKLGPQPAQGKQPGPCSWARPREGAGHDHRGRGTRRGDRDSFLQPGTIHTSYQGSASEMGSWGTSGPGTPTEERERQTNPGGVTVSYSGKGLAFSPALLTGPTPRLESSAHLPFLPQASYVESCVLGKPLAEMVQRPSTAEPSC